MSSPALVWQTPPTAPTWATLRRWARAMVAVVTLSLCAGCAFLFAPDDLEDVARVRDHVRDAAERDMPVIAEQLDATIVSAGLWVELQGGSQRSHYDVNISAPGHLDGEKPTQKELEDALRAAGYTGVKERESPYPDEFDDPSARGESPDGSIWVSLAYNSDPVSKYRYDFYVVSNESLTISYSDGETYRYQDHRGFDQSLVTPLED